MKISWGYKILFGYLAFVAGMVCLVIMASSEKFELVTKDYYEQELAYQNIIDQAGNTAGLSAPITVEQTATQLRISFPEELGDQKKAGLIYLYCPADSKRDFRKSFESNENTYLQELPVAMKGMYELKLSWQVNNIKYYFEKKLFF